MSLLGLLNQTINIYTKSSYNAYGREVVGTATEIHARVQAVTKQRLLPNGSIINILALAYVPSDTTVNIDDKVSYGGVDYKVFGKYATPDGTGTTSFIKLELVKWKAT